MGAMFLTSALNRGSHLPEILKMATNTGGGEMLLLRALARNMAPMTYMTTTPCAFLNEVVPLCSLYSLVRAKARAIVCA